MKRSLVLALALGLFAPSALLVTPTAAMAQARPLIERIEPTAGPPGTTVRIHGRGFSRGYTVLFNERPLTPTEVLPERLTVTLPEGASTGRFVLSNRPGQRGADEVETEVFRVTAQAPAPTVSAIEPATAAPGMEVVLRGENFATRATDNVVRIGALPMVVRAGDASTLRVIVPDGAVTGPVFVRAGGSPEGQSQAVLTLTPRLIIRELSTMAVAPGGRVILRGAGFSPVIPRNRVTLGGRPLRVLRATATELEVEVPVGAESATLAIEVQGAGRYEMASRLFVGPAPAVTAMSPPAASVGQRVTLRGSNFGTDLGRVQVTVGGRPAVVSAVTPTELTITVPEGATTGRVAVTASGIGPVDSTTDFTVLVPVSLSRFEPRAADVGDRITLFGAGFSTAPAQNAVTLNNTRLTVVSATATELVCELTPGSRSGNLAVAVEGNGNARLREPFMVTVRPRISAMEPDRGPPGTAVVLRAANLPADRSLVQVRISGVDVPIESYTREAVTVRVPPNAQSGRFSIVVRLQGTGATEQPFTVLQPVTLAAVEPPAGPVGATVTLRGTGFEPELPRLRVRLGATLIRPLRNSTTEIVFTVPRGSRGGPVSVEAEGRQTVTSPEPFAITVPPVLVGFAPLAVTPGQTLTLRGRNLGTSTATTGVLIGDVTCPASEVSPTRIACVVPVEARTGPVVVRVANAGEARARGNLTVRQGPPGPPGPRPR